MMININDVPRIARDIFVDEDRAIKRAIENYIGHDITNGDLHNLKDRVVISIQEGEVSVFVDGVLVFKSLGARLTKNNTLQFEFFVYGDTV